MGNLNETLSALTKVKSGDVIETVITSNRINAIQDAIHALARGDNVNSGPNIRKRTGTGWFTLSGAAGGGTGRSASNSFPFEVYSGTINNQTVVGVKPGRVCQVMPTMGGVNLNNDPAPSFATFNGNFSVFLKVSIDQITPSAIYRSAVVSALITTDNDAGVIADFGENGEVPEMKIFWTNSQQSIGYFYVKLADVSYNVPTGSPPNTPRSFVVEEQFLSSNIETLVAVGSSAIILTTS